MTLFDYQHNHTHHHETSFPSAGCRGPVALPKQPPRDGPIVPSNCKTHLTCKPIHPNRPDSWSSWSGYVGDWFAQVGLILAGTAVVVGGCIYGKMVLDNNRKKRRDARFAAEGKKPPTDGESEGESEEEDERGQRG